MFEENSRDGFGVTHTLKTVSLSVKPVPQVLLGTTLEDVFWYLTQSCPWNQKLCYSTTSYHERKDHVTIQTYFAVQ